MFKRKRRNEVQPFLGTGHILPDSTPMTDVFIAFINDEKELGVLDDSSIKAHETRLLSNHGNNSIGKACRKAGLKTVGDLPEVSFRLINKEIERLSATRAQANNCKSSFKKALIRNIELGNIPTLPSLRGIKQQKNRPCSPAQLTNDQIAFIRKSNMGRTQFLAARNNLIELFELLYGIRPGQEITQIDNDNVHPEPEKEYMDILRDDGLMQRVYLRRDTCDLVAQYRRLRTAVLLSAGETDHVKPFFIKERNI